MMRKKLKNYIKQKETELAGHIDDIKQNFTNQLKEVTEELNILKAATESKGTLLMKEIGILDGAAKAEQLRSKIGVWKFYNLSNDSSSIFSGGSSISRK